ncbi:MAG TPA: Rne/Rng family ribonuclease [Blastocatellia bacterium]
MAKELIISANVHEKKVAIIEDGLVTEFYVERRDENQGVVGNLYKGRVMKVLPGMQSAFVDIGLDRDAFLYVSDFTEFMEEEDEIDFRDPGEDLRPAPRVEDRARRGDRPRTEAVAPRHARPPARDEDASRDEEVSRDEDSSYVSPASIEDAVEQLAEIADESVIPPPPTEDELERAEPELELAEARVAPIEEFNVERITDEQPAPSATPDATPEPAEDASRVSREVFARAVEAEEAEVEAPKRGRSRKKGADAKAEKPEPRGRKKTPKAEDKPEEKTAAAKPGSRRGAGKATAKRTSRKRGGETESDSESVSSSEEEFQRVTDEDLAIDAGDLLKDAILQEKFTEQIHNAEYSTAPFQPEPEPEWRVGSFRSQVEGGSDFHRVVDETAEQSPARDVDASSYDTGRGPQESPAPGYDDSSASPFRHISDVLPAGLRGAMESGGAGEISEVSGIAASGEQGQGSSVENFSSPEKSPQGDEEIPDEDREAGVSDRGGRAEFAIRRGGRGRRGRRPNPAGGAPAPGPDREAGDATTAIMDADENAAEGDGVDEIARPSEARPVESRISDIRGGEPRGSEPRGGDPRSGESRPGDARAGGPRHQDSRYDRRPDGQRRPDDRRPDGQRRPDGPPRRPERSLPPTISELLHEGQEILVQIAKEPIAKKGARITSHIALPGRLLVYMPTVNHVGVSRKIPNDQERIRLKRIVTSLREREGGTGGFIARTACAGHTEQELQDDMRYLLRTWADVRKKADRVKAPAMVHQDLDLVQRILRDQLAEDFTAIRIDNEVEYARIVEFVNRVQPKLVKRVKLYVGNLPIFEKYAIQPEIDKAVRPRVWLKSGGYIVINQTEALVAIDVNTGKFVGKSDKLEDTITRTNLEAAKEIVRQIRLRDLGGIIVLDLIDMEERKNRQRVMAALQQELQTDRAPSKILSINDFGLVAITRKRVKQSLERTLCSPCPYCQGAGMVKSAQTMCFEILEQAKAMSKEVNGSSDVMLRVSPHVAEAFRSTEREVLEEIEAYFGTPVTLEADPNLHQEQYDFAVM